MSDSRLLLTIITAEVAAAKPVRKLKKRRSVFVSCGTRILSGKSAAVAGVGVFGRQVG
ncbi:MAG: hypothetical protein ACLR2M_06275 [Varibaculum sp.]